MIIKLKLQLSKHVQHLSLFLILCYSYTMYIALKLDL